LGEPSKVHDLTLHYYLADDTIEVLEKIKANSGRDNVPVFLHRGKLLRNSPVPAYMPGDFVYRRVYNKQEKCLLELFRIGLST
jgi:hypothetical protein